MLGSCCLEKECGVTEEKERWQDSPFGGVLGGLPAGSQVERPSPDKSKCRYAVVRGRMSSMQSRSEVWVEVSFQSQNITVLPISVYATLGALAPY